MTSSNRLRKLPELDHSSSWIALVGPELEENLSLRYLASSLEVAGFQTEILPFNGPGDFVPVLDAISLAPTPPLVVGISLAFQWRATDFLALAVALRERGYRGHITAGGHFGAFAWREVLADFPEVDSICQHEAEETLVELAQTVQSGAKVDSIPGLAVPAAKGALRTPLRKPPDLGSLPWPDRRGRPASCLGHKIATLVASRGCYSNCAFCCIAAWHRNSIADGYHRLRPVEDVADEMAWLHHHHGIDLFNFHDDNFLPRPRERALDRVGRLADALESRGVTRFGTLIKARPSDVTVEVFTLLKERLGLTRLFLGLETDTEQGLRTLRRGVTQRQNREAMRIVRELEIYVFFNMLIFDPDTTVESLESNLAFMEASGRAPLNFGRVELYAGTPLLTRMQSEKRVKGDYMGWDYSLANERMQRIYELATRCFYPRNFAPSAAAHRLIGTRFDVEVCRRFHRDFYRDSWLTESEALSAALTRDTVRGLREIVSFVCDQGTGALERELVTSLSRRLRAKEKEVHEAASSLEGRIRKAVGRDCQHARPAAALGALPVRAFPAYLEA